MVVTEHTYLTEIRKSFKLYIMFAMLVTCAGDRPNLSIIKFDKRGMFWHWSPQYSRKDRNWWFYKQFLDTHVTQGTEISFV